MSHRIELENLELSAPSIGLCLFVSSYLLTSGEVTSRLGRHELCRHVQSGHLRLLPPNIFYLNLHMEFDGRPMDTVPPESNILEYFATAICLSTSWDMLGLCIKCKEISYDPEDKGEPNLVFEIEHPDKSSALLSPPHVRTSTANGLICFLTYTSMPTPGDSNNSDLDQHRSNGDQVRRQDHSVEQSDNVSLAVDCSKPLDLNDDCRHEDGRDMATSQQRHIAVGLAIAAIDRLIGVKKRPRGIRLGPSVSPTLLELAPSVCNAHYLQTMAAYAKTLSGISGIIAAAGEWRPSLQQKVLQLTESEPYGITGENMCKDRDKMQIAVQQKLWTLLHTYLDSTTGIRGALANIDVQTRRLELQDVEAQLFPKEINGLTQNEERKAIEDIYHCRYEATGTYCSDQSMDWEPSAKYADDDTTLDLEEQFKHGYRNNIVDYPLTKEARASLQLNTQYMIGSSTEGSFMELCSPEDFQFNYRMQSYEMERYVEEHGMHEDDSGRASGSSCINVDSPWLQVRYLAWGNGQDQGWGDPNSRIVADS